MDMGVGGEQGKWEEWDRVQAEAKYPLVNYHREARFRLFGTGQSPKIIMILLKSNRFPCVQDIDSLIRTLPKRIDPWFFESHFPNTKINAQRAKRVSFADLFTQHTRNRLQKSGSKNRLSPSLSNSLEEAFRSSSHGSAGKKALYAWKQDNYSGCRI